MKLSLKAGLPLLALLLLGVGLTEGSERTLLLLLGMGVALWCAFSLPHPGPKPTAEPEGAHADGQPMLPVDDGTSEPEQASPPGTNGSGGAPDDRPLN
ncbi:MAG: hypothetical protein GWO39_06415, partial [Gammaproteobacteria bacterium]|nr:hypothetical protein [Gammaproteobacteria bacterium]NIT63429.1 hypothetical protein [Gammaproteobacteria bacterium]NIV20343.1 hypothetical protein [Gammaproteobacteria bacterium]NIY32009.1 hypothetical protein [Gammaproteobacteria bacterium]